MYQFIFFALVLNVCDVKAQGYAKFENDPDQRKLCRVNTREAACVANSKCAWHPTLWECNDKGYQPDIQHCQERKCVLNDGYQLGVCPTPYQDGWKVVFELEDDEGVDDVPNSWSTRLNGFERPNSYFVGVNRLKQLDDEGYGTRIQLCAGYRASSDGCPRVKCNDLHPSKILDVMPENFKKYNFKNKAMRAILCFLAADNRDKCHTYVHPHIVTKWKLPIGYADDPAPMTTYGNAQTGELKWTCVPGHAQGWGFEGFYFLGNGLQANYQQSNDELSMNRMSWAHKCIQQGVPAGANNQNNNM